MRVRPSRWGYNRGHHGARTAHFEGPWYGTTEGLWPGTILEERLGFPAAPLEKQLSHEEESKVARAYNRAQHWDGAAAGA